MHEDRLGPLGHVHTNGITLAQKARRPVRADSSGRIDNRIEFECFPCSALTIQRKKTHVMSFGAGERRIGTYEARIGTPDCMSIGCADPSHALICLFRRVPTAALGRNLRLPELDFPNFDVLASGLVLIFNSATLVDDLEELLTLGQVRLEIRQIIESSRMPFGWQ